MTTRREYNRYGEELEKLLRLAESPLAVKMLKKESEIPADAVRPKPSGYHLSQCQAFGMARRDRVPVAMLKEDHWCPGPMISYGLVPPDSSEKSTHEECEHFQFGKYIGLLATPLKLAGFRPDVVLIYADTYQIGNLLYAMKEEEHSRIGTQLFAPSCVYSITTTMATGRYQVVLPDPGEFVRGLTLPGTILLSIPGKKLPELMADLKEYQAKFPKLLMAGMMLRPDFPQPPPYRKAFQGWGLDYQK